MLKIYNYSYKYNDMDIMARMVVTYDWLTNVNILSFQPQAEMVPNLTNLPTCANRDNQEISTHNHDCDRPSGMLHREAW